MPAHVIRARAPRGGAADVPRIERDPEVLASFLEDAAHFPGGVAEGVAVPASEAEVAAPAALGAGRASDWRAIVADRRRDADGRHRAQHGAPEPRPRDRRAIACGSRPASPSSISTRRSGAPAGCYPPVPTFNGAFVGGIVATNAAGAATFKYGTTRDWVEALTVVLPDGDVLDVERGRTHGAIADGCFEIDAVPAAPRAFRCRAIGCPTCRSCPPAISPRPAWT